MEKPLYVFEECGPEQYQFRVEYIGQKSRRNAEDYRAFLEGMGYRTLFKNVNLNDSVGKVRYHPWAEKGGRIATNATPLHRELPIVEREQDGNPFALHTSLEDRAEYHGILRNPWLCMLLVFGVLGIINRSPLFGVLALIAPVSSALYQIQIMKINREARTKEW